MRVWAVILFAVAAPSAFAASDELTVDDLTWSTVSPNAAIELKQTATALNACHLTCTSDGGSKELWSGEVCLANKNQLRFVSNDGEKVIVLEPLPARLGSSWRGSAVVFLYHRTELEKQATASALVRDATKVRELARHFYWLGGVLGVPGNPAHYRDDASGVDLEAIDGRPKTIRFDGTEFPVAPSHPASKTSKAKRR